MSSKNAKEIFLHAVEQIRPANWPQYLDEACHDDAELRQKAELLLANHRQSVDLADQARQAGLDALPTAIHLAAETAGARIGPYKLLQEIGEGGMGVVWMAEQQQPVRRRVALKVIKPGMDSRQVMARFEAERQALAMMDHQNIAKVLEAGTTDSGRPFFVMELVHGVPLTKFCEDNRFTLRQRLELLIPVCHAIQHAHQKGIIHRDIKPNNILVTMYDDLPVPKVIDFGVAKAIEQRLTEKTLFTQYGTLVGTLEYMSPEQAGMNALGVDTRSDVYSLGVLLYELLTGTTPLERSRLPEVAWHELLKRIKEEEPPRPSLRLSSSGTLKQFAADCRVEPAKLPRMLSGELDWIVMKCLEKDRSRRYETATGLARDLQRYLADEPVEACPPSWLYRLRKSARKHRWALTTAASFAALLILGMVVSLSLAVREMKSREEANLAMRAAEVALANETVARSEAEAARMQAELTVEQFRSATRLVNEGLEFVGRKQWATAHHRFSEAITTEPNYREAYIQRATLYTRFGLWDQAAADFEHRFQIADRANAVTHFEQAVLRMYAEDTAGHRRACLNFVSGYGESSHDGHRESIVRSLALSPSPVIEPNDLAKLGEQVLGAKRDSYRLFVSALAQLRTGNQAQAVDRFREALERGANSPGGIHRSGYAPLAIALFQLGRRPEAEEALVQAQETLEDWTISIAKSPADKMPINWKDWLEFRVYLREANKLIKGETVETDQRLVERQRKAWDFLTSTDGGDGPQNDVQVREDSTTVNVSTEVKLDTSAPSPEESPVPKVWVDSEMENLELPLANATATPRHVPADYYYRIPEWQMYRSYPVYHPEHEPAGYFEKLLTAVPEVVWGSNQRPTLESDADWKAAGALVFDMPIGFGSGHVLPTTETSLFVRDANWYVANDVPTTRDGVNPFYRYVVRELGKVEVGVLSCAMCHTRVLNDGTVVKGAQGNFPFSRVYAAQILEQGAIPAGVRALERNLYGAPWVTPDTQEQLWSTPLAQIAAPHGNVPSGVLARHRASPFSPVVVPDLFQLRTRRYLDRTGLQRHQSVVDLMRYVALNQGMDNLSHFGDFVPAGGDFKTLPEPESYFFHRYSDDQLFALAKYTYSLQPPANPHGLDERAERGRQVFVAQACGRCHEPEKNYGSDRLVAAPGFHVPADHPEKAQVMSRRVNTDAALTLTTRRGTGFYKIPSLRSVWLRGPFEHNGSVATLEDWFDPRRIEEDYIPTGWKGPPGTETRAVPGHPYGLKLAPHDKAALIAFLKTL